jgi:uncharacterized PurR-regulated membrane protein YhhQ (DUF165 family)
MLLVPLGAFAWPIAILALDLAGELYGKRRARALLLVLFVVWLGVVGLSWATDNVRDYNATTTNAFFVGATLAATHLLASIVQVELFGAIRARWLRHLAAPVVAIAIGWGALALAFEHLAVPGAPAGDELLGVALGGAGYTLAAVLLATIPTVLVARALAVYLRVARDRTLFDEDDVIEPAFVKKKPFTTDEMAFFDAGDKP